MRTGSGAGMTDSWDERKFRADRQMGLANGRIWLAHGSAAEDDSYQPCLRLFVPGQDMPRWRYTYQLSCLLYCSVGFGGLCW